MRKRSVLVALVFSSLSCLSPLAAEPVIQHGIDVFTTPADGKTFYDFAQRPIPAGFFCKSSQSFTGRVAFKGLPLATGTPGELRGGDTIIERLDDATFNAKGTAVTRIQFRALSLVSIAPIKTSCGDFHLYVSLGGPQRVTAMSIYRTQENGGSFVAPLAVNARLTFIPVKPARSKSARKLEVTGSFTFPPQSRPWGLITDTTAKKIGPVVVDTNGDLTPDALLPGTSNFTPGVVTGAPNSNKYISLISCCPVCHSADGEQHCYTPSPCNQICGMEPR